MAADISQAKVRSMLEQQYKKSVQKNAKFSLRAFAKVLGVSPASLSLFLRGKRTLRRTNLEKIVRRLGLAGDVTISATKGAEGTDLEGTEQDVYEVTRYWQDFAILNLAEIRGAKGEAKWIAKRLGLRLRDAENSLKRLTRLGLLKVSASGVMDPIKQDLVVGGFRRSEAIHLRSQDLLHRSLKTLSYLNRHNVTGLSDVGCITVATSQEAISAARVKLRALRRQVGRHLDKAPTKDQVYLLMTQLIPLTLDSSRSESR